MSHVSEPLSLTVFPSSMVSHRGGVISLDEMQAYKAGAELLHVFSIQLLYVILLSSFWGIS